MGKSKAVRLSHIHTVLVEAFLTILKISKYNYHKFSIRKCDPDTGPLDCKTR